MAIRFLDEKPKTIRFLDEPQAPEQKGFIERTTESLQQRGRNLADLTQQKRSGEKFGIEVGFERVGEEFGAAGDIIGQGLVSAGRTFKEALPTEARQVFEKKGTELRQTEIAQAGSRLLQGVGEKAGELAEEFPRTADLLGAAGNIAGLGIGGGAAKPALVQGAKVARAGKDVAEAGVDVITKSTKAGAVKTLLPTLDARTATQAERFTKDFGIELRLDQISDSRVRSTVQKVGQEIPFSGDVAFETAQRSDFTKAIAKTIGQKSDDLSPEVILKFRKDVGEKFDSVLKGKQITVPDNIMQQLNDIKTEARRTIETGLADVVDTNADILIKEIQEGAIKTGEKLASTRSEMMKAATIAKGGSGDLIGKIVDVLDNIADKNLSVAEVASLNEAKRQWRNFKTIQPLLEKSVDGSINPTELLTRVKANPFMDASKIPDGVDDLVDLARGGKRFLAKKGGSDTAQKQVLTKLITGTTAGGAAGATLGAPAAIAAAGGIAAVNRGIQAANRSQKLVDAALKASKKK